MKWLYNTTMTTGNLRTAFRAAYLVVVDGGNEAKVQARSFLAVIFALFVGALFGGYTPFELGPRAVWMACLTLVLGLLVFSIDDRHDRRLAGARDGGAPR